MCWMAAIVVHYAAILHTSTSLEQAPITSTAHGTGITGPQAKLYDQKDGNDIQV